MGWKCDYGKCLLVSLNVLFGVIGLALVVGAFIFAFDRTAYESQADDLISNLTFGVHAESSDEITNARKDLQTIVQYASYTGLALGSISLVTACCGASAAASHVRCLLVSYIVILFTLMGLEIAAMAFWIDNQIQEKIISQLNLWLRDKYQSFEDFHATSFFINVIQVQLNCCGMKNYTDWKEATAWHKHLYVGGVDYTQVIPESCCRVRTENSQNLSTSVHPPDNHCTVTPTKYTAHITKACEPALTGFFSEYTIYVLGGLGAACFLHLTALVITSCVWVRRRRSKARRKPEMSRSVSEMTSLDLSYHSVRRDRNPPPHPMGGIYV